MRPVEINLAAEPYRNDLPIAAALVVLALVAFGLTGWESYAFFSAGARRSELQAELAGHGERMQKMRATGERVSAELHSVDDKVLASKASFVTGILQQRNFSWTGLFNALERVQPWNVRLVGIRPSVDAGTMTISVDGVAQDMEGYLAFQEALLHDPAFGNVQPSGYQREEAGQRIAFHLSADYHPGAAVPEKKPDESAAAAPAPPAPEPEPQAAPVRRPRTDRAEPPAGNVVTGRGVERREPRPIDPAQGDPRFVQPRMKRDSVPLPPRPQPGQEGGR